MGHLGGGSERDVSPTNWFYDKTNFLFPDRNVEQNTNPNLAGIHDYILVSFLQIYDKGVHRRNPYRDWAEFNIPTPFGSRVRNALKAEACSVRLSNLVGAGGLWYGFGKTIMDMYVTYDCRVLHRSVNSSSRSLSDEQANEMSDMLSKVRPISLN
jgi:hypothetical protein